MEEKSLLFITSRVPFPATSGRKNSLYNYCKIIKRLGYKVIVASFDDDTDVSLKPNFIDELHMLPNINKLKKVRNLIYYSFLLKKYPMQVSLYYDKKIANKIESLINKCKPQIIIADMVRTTEYLQKVIGTDIVTIADLDDRLSLRYQRQLECDIKDVNPYGLFLNSLPIFLQKILLLNFIKIKVMRREIKLLKKYEIDIGRKTDYTIFVSAIESQAFNEELGEKKAITIPIGVDVKYFKNIESQLVEKENIIGFLGVLNVSHNENAVKRFIKDIFPLVKSKCNDAKFMIIGGGANDALLSMANDSIIFTGKVDDVRKYLRKCKVFVCPLSFGSGIKTKNLESMALGIPVVTTLMGAENINAINDKDWFVTDDNEKFAKIICELLKDSIKAYNIGKNGSIYITNNFTWEIAKKRFKQILK